MVPPNLFDFATKELCQDAVICWLIAWADSRSKGHASDDGLHLCGRTFVDALFSKWQDWGEVDLGDSVRTKVVRQEHNIDVLALVNGRVLLIEDKTDTGAHNDQLERYWDSVVEGQTPLGNVDTDDLFPIYFKTGNHSIKDRQHAESEEYRVFDRTDFLRVLDTYNGTNAILVDFRRYLAQWERETDSFR